MDVSAAGLRPVSRQIDRKVFTQESKSSNSRCLYFLSISLYRRVFR